MAEWTPREWTRRQGRLKQDVAKNSQRPASVETVQGGVPPYGVKETLVVNGKYQKSQGQGPGCGFFVQECHWQETVVSLVGIVF